MGVRVMGGGWNKFRARAPKTQEAKGCRQSSGGAAQRRTAQQSEEVSAARKAPTKLLTPWSTAPWPGHWPGLAGRRAPRRCAQARKEWPLLIAGSVFFFALFAESRRVAFYIGTTSLRVASKLI